MLGDHGVDILCLTGTMVRCPVFATLAALAICGSSFRSNEAFAQTTAIQRDKWGLSDSDWLTKEGPDLRIIAGLPAGASRIIAAAKSGDVKAAAILAGAYAVGDGVPKDEVEGMRWAQVAANGKLPFGYYALALKYEKGSGVAADQNQFRHYLKLAADAGQVHAQLTYGFLLVDYGHTLVPYAANQVPELQGIAHSLEGRGYIQRAADAGEARAARILAAWEYNDRFVAAGNGMPIWKDARGLLGGHGNLWATHPCRTSVKRNGGGHWIVHWSQTKAVGGVKGMLELKGYIYASDLHKVSNVFGFFEFEGASRNLERSRANFAEMKEMADEVHAVCSVAAAW